MDPKVWSKLLTLHRKGYGVDVEAPSGGAPEKAPRWDIMDTESYDGGITVLALYLVVWGYIGIYRRKEYVGGATGGPRGRGGAPHPCDRLCYVLEWGPSLLDHVRLENHVPEGFIPFGLRFIFRFFETLK